MTRIKYRVWGRKIAWSIRIIGRLRGDGAERITVIVALRTDECPTVLSRTARVSKGGRLKARYVCNQTRVVRVKIRTYVTQR